MADTKQRTQISVDDAQRQLRDLEMRYGSGVQITVDEDFNFELVTNEDLSEETPEESAKRAERQAEESRKAALKSDQATAGTVTLSADALRAAAPKAQAERAEATPTKR